MALRAKLIYGDYQLEIPANPYPMYPWPERLNHISLDSATGERHIFDYGPTRVNASISWKAIHYNIIKEYENFLLNIVKFGLHPFVIICPDYIDFGNGIGVPIEYAHYAGSANLKDVISARDDSGLYYDMELPYMFVRENV
jgi:hypothetical protein